MKTAVEYLEEAEAKASERLEHLGGISSENDIKGNIQAYQSFVIQAMKDYAREVANQAIIDSFDHIQYGVEFDRDGNARGGAIGVSDFEINTP